jgi:hypothetical protein
MRVALCLSGQPRSFQETYPYIYHNIIVPNHADVFVHLHYDASSPSMEKTHMGKGSCDTPVGADDAVFRMYKPLRYLVESPRNIQKPGFKVPEQRIDGSCVMNAGKQWSREEHSRHLVKQLTSMYYSMFKCNELKEVYANEHGIVYDYVIRIRFDAKPMMPLVCSQYDPNWFYYQELGQPDNLCSDWINFGSNAIMNVYTSMYFLMDYLSSLRFLQKGDRQVNTLEPSAVSPGFSEYLVRDLLYRCNIPVKAFDIGTCLCDR